MTSGSLRYQTIWLSDIHLGSRQCKVEFLREFLSRTRSKTLYLVGDVIDLWSMKNQWYWPPEHAHLLRTLMEMGESGTSVFYVPGNHDEAMREFARHAFGNVCIDAQRVHTTLDGRRLLVTHGDEFECAIRCGAIVRFVGDASYTVLLRLNRTYNRIRAWRGKPYWSLAAHVKNRVGNARRAIDAFETAAARAAREQGYDGVICGHIHQPRIRDIDGTLYCNDGDWVDSCTALVERLDGRLELLHWSELQAQEERAAAANDPLLPAYVLRDSPIKREAPHVHR